MTIGIVGVGYVGLPLAPAFAEAGHEVIGVDVDPRRVAAVNQGPSHVEDVSSARLRGVEDRLVATTSYAELDRAEAILVCVPTPLSANREPELGPLVDAATSLAKVLRRDQLVVLESTTYPGTTRERLKPILEESGLAAGRDFHLAYSPERGDPRRRDHSIRTTPKVVGGVNHASTERAVELYSVICDTVVPVSSPDAAELSN